MQLSGNAKISITKSLLKKIWLEWGPKCSLARTEFLFK